MKKIYSSLLLLLLLFFSNQNSFSQNYTDEEIGFDEAKLIQKLINKGISSQEIPELINIERALYIEIYQSMLTSLKSFDNNLSFSSQSNLSSSSSSSLVGCEVSPAERQALIDFYNATDGPNWINKTNWNTTADVCDWYGVTVTNGKVISLDLNENQLTGVIPSELGNLLDIENIYLNDNHLSGNIPIDLANLTNLRGLNLGNNLITGSIPPQLGNLVNLTHLYLYSNQLTGSIIPELGDLSNINHLSLSNNQLTGSIPPELGNLTNLQQLYLNSNQLTDNIPVELGNLLNLNYLQLHNNQIDGSIPYQLGNLTNLTILYLHSNQLTGEIPVELSNLSNLSTLYLHDNLLTGFIPTELENLTNLKVLYLYSNQLTGNIPPELGNLSSLISLRLHHNQLTGSIPEELGNLSSLSSLFMSNNQLEGAIPDELGNLTSLIWLSLSSNQLEGVIPSLISLIDPLNTFSFASNRFIFGDFENEHTIYDTNITNYNYSPQAKVDQIETINITEGDNYQLTTSLSSANNHYQWEHSIDGGTTWLPIGADSSTYTITSATASNAGMYRFFATNDVISGLTLERNVITVNVNEATIFCNEKTEAEVALTNLLNHLIDKLKVGETITSGYNPVEMQVFSQYITCLKPAIYDFSVLLGESGLAFGFSFGSNNCCEQEIVLYYINCPDENGNIPNTEEARINKLTSIANVSIDLSGSFELEYDNFITCDAPYYSLSNIFPITQSISCLNINCNYLDDDNIFCYNDYLDDLTVANLFPRGDNIFWYETEVGGEPYSPSDILVEEAENEGGVSYWWDDISDGIATRTEVIVKILIDIEGDTEQVFSKYAPIPTIADIEVYNSGEPIYWYETNSSTTVLDSNTPLADGETYYASSCDENDNSCPCRFAVTITIGVIPPSGEIVQYLCEQSTLNDIVLDFEDEHVLSIVWYDSELGGNVLDGNTPVVENTTYYAVQKDANNEESNIRFPVRVSIVTTPDPIVTKTIQKFYADNNPTIANLRAIGRRKVEGENNILWYSLPSGGTPYSTDYPLENGNTYYAEQIYGACPSNNRVAVTVEISPLSPEPLFGCELYRPELLGHYVIDAWVNEREVNTNTIADIAFNDSAESDLFVALLNHLKNKLMSTNTKLHDVPEVYEPIFTAEETQLDLGPLMVYIEGLSASEKKLLVYDFMPIKDEYGRAIGFSFYLNAAKANGTQIIYKTPTFTYQTPKKNSSGVEMITKTEHYPLLDNTTTLPDDFLKFTEVKINVSGDFEIHADFNQENDPSPLTLNHISVDSNSGAIKESATYFEYIEVDYQATPSYNQASIEISFLDENGLTISNKTFSTHGIIIDKWQKITGDFVVPNDAGKMIIALKNNDTDKVVYFDDLRIYPYEGNIKTFVYHPENQRLKSELDENNYATYYEYDQEGGLIRVKKETVKGIYTIQETRSGNIKTSN